VCVLGGHGGGGGGEEALKLACNLPRALSPAISLSLQPHPQDTAAQILRNHLKTIDI
jgi:hypothetical protein